MSAVHPPYRAVLFDFDGTLAPSLPLWVKAFARALAHFKHELSEREILQRCFFRDWHDIAADFGTFSAQELEIRVNEQLTHAFGEAELFPEVESLLRDCRMRALQVAMVTSAPRHLIAGVLERLQLATHFDFVICGDEVQNYKPHPEPVRRALDALGRKPQEAIMIGDSHADILAGKAAGTHTALFLPDDHHRFHDTHRLRATEPDHIFREHGELAAILNLA